MTAFSSASCREMLPCGGPHLAPVCKFKDTICGCCKKKGHLAKVRKSKSDITIAKLQSLTLVIKRIYICKMIRWIMMEFKRMFKLQF